MLYGGAVNTSVFTTNTITNVTFLVLRVDHHAGSNDDVYLFVNPLLSAQPQLAQASARLTNQAEFSFNAVRIFAAYASNTFAELRLDEIRVGDTYADVAPFTPAAVTLAPVAAASTATLFGTVNAGGVSATAWFEWGLTANYGNSTPATNYPT